jgi:peroxidase
LVCDFAGDLRATEHDALFVLQVLFLRNHNRLARLLQHSAGASASDEELYQAARALNIAQYQHIVFNEFLPVYLGSGAPPPYAGYNPSVDPRITNEFAAAAFRLGHSLVGCEIKGFEYVSRGLFCCDCDCKLT